MTVLSLKAKTTCNTTLLNVSFKPIQSSRTDKTF